MTLSRRPVSLALTAMLAAATGRPVGFGQRPRDDDGAEPTLPYGVVFPLAGSEYTGPPLENDDDTASWPYQVDAVGQTVEQAEALADRIRTAILDRHGALYTVPLVADGVLVLLRTFDEDGGAVPGDGLVSMPQRFTVHATRPDGS